SQGDAIPADQDPLVDPHQPERPDGAITDFRFHDDIAVAFYRRVVEEICGDVSAAADRPLFLGGHAAKGYIAVGFDRAFSYVSLQLDSLGCLDGKPVEHVAAYIKKAVVVDVADLEVYISLYGVGILNGYL